MSAVTELAQRLRALERKQPAFAARPAAPLRLSAEEAAEEALRYMDELEMRGWTTTYHWGYLEPGLTLEASDHVIPCSEAHARVMAQRPGYVLVTRELQTSDWRAS